MEGAAGWGEMHGPALLQALVRGRHLPGAGLEEEAVFMGLAACC